MKPSISTAAVLSELVLIERQIRSLSQRKNYLKRLLGERTRVYVWRDRKAAA